MAGKNPTMVYALLAKSYCMKVAINLKYKRKLIHKYVCSCSFLSFTSWLNENVPKLCTPKKWVKSWIALKLVKSKLHYLFLPLGLLNPYSRSNKQQHTLVSSSSFKPTIKIRRHLHLKILLYLGYTHILIMVIQLSVWLVRIVRYSLYFCRQTTIWWKGCDIIM